MTRHVRSQIRLGWPSGLAVVSVTVAEAWVSVSVVAAVSAVVTSVVGVAVAITVVSMVDSVSVAITDSVGRVAVEGAGGLQVSGLLVRRFSGLRALLDTLSQGGGNEAEDGESNLHKPKNHSVNQRHHHMPKLLG